TKPGQEVIVLEHGERPAGVRLAFQVAPGSDLGELAARLSKAGIKSERRSGLTPGIAQAIVFTDPKGTSLELFSDYAFAKDDDNYTGVMPRKLGHVAFHTPDVAATVKFYCDVLGFKVSDWRSDFFAFLRCSRDHHTINLLQADNANIHHLAFELRDEAEINRACDFLARKNIKLFCGPIRHLIGHNIPIYHKNPDGITVEFFTDIDLTYDEELGYFEPRPWHQDRPQRPKVWATTRRRTIGDRDTRTTCRGRRSDGARRSSFAGPHARADGRLRSAAFRNRSVGESSLRPHRLALPHLPRALVRGSVVVVGELLFLAFDEGDRPPDRDRLGELTRIHLRADRPERRQPHVWSDHGIAVAAHQHDVCFAERLGDRLAERGSLDQKIG